MLELTYPWALLIVFLPILMRILPAYRESRESVKVPFFGKIAELSDVEPSRGSLILRRDRAQRFLVGLMWIALVIGASKPVWVSAPVEQKKSGRDLMLAVDLSGSMAKEDFALAISEEDNTGKTINRLEAVKIVLRELASDRPSDRLGLIVFGSNPYLQTPFTEDHKIWASLLEETEIGMAGQSTVFGDAIGLAIKLFRENDSDNRVLIILTDGNDTGSLVPPREAAKIAAENDIRIYIIAIGDPASVGEDALDLETIERVTEITNGTHFQALNQAELSAAYATIAQLEPNLYETISYQTRQSLHWIPPAFALLLISSYHLIGAWRFRTLTKQAEDVHAS